MLKRKKTKINFYSKMSVLFTIFYSMVVFVGMKYVESMPLEFALFILTFVTWEAVQLLIEHGAILSGRDKDQELTDNWIKIVCLTIILITVLFFLV